MGAPVPLEEEGAARKVPLCFQVSLVPFPLVGASPRKPSPCEPSHLHATWPSLAQLLWPCLKGEVPGEVSQVSQSRSLCLGEGGREAHHPASFGCSLVSSPDLPVGAPVQEAGAGCASQAQP